MVIQLTERDREVLWHMHRHGVTAREPLYKLFSLTKNAANTLLSRLCKVGATAGEGLVAKKELEGKHKLYHLTASGQAAIGVSGKPLPDSALNASLLALWYCAMGKERRLLLTHNEAEELLERKGLSPARRCITPLGEMSVLEEFYVPDLGTEPKNSAGHVRGKVLEFSRNPALREWIRTGAFQLTVLVLEKTKRDHIKGLVLDSPRSRAGNQVRVVVRQVPEQDLLRKLLPRKQST